MKSIKSYQNDGLYLYDNYPEKDNDYGQFCDLEEPITPAKSRLPSMESIPETIEHSISHQSIENYIEQNSHPVVNDIENILNVKQYIYKMTWETDRKKKQLLYNMLCALFVCGLVTYSIRV